MNDNHEIPFVDEVPETEIALLPLHPYCLFFTASVKLESFGWVVRWKDIESKTQEREFENGHDAYAFYSELTAETKRGGSHKLYNYSAAEMHAFWSDVYRGYDAARVPF